MIERLVQLLIIYIRIPSFPYTNNIMESSLTFTRYHLIASIDEDDIKMLDNMVITHDPLMNPDGRARFTKSLEEKGYCAKLRNQSLLHTGDFFISI